MTYAAWEQAFTNAVDGDEAWASKWNLDHEVRVNRKRGSFRRRIGARFNALASKGTPSRSAALQVLDEAIQAINQIGHPWEGLLKPVWKNALPDTRYFSYIVAEDAARYGAAAHIDLRNPPARFRFAKAHMTNAGGRPARRFIWVSFEPDGRDPSNDPTEVVRVMGLDHFPAGSLVYRFELEVKKEHLRPPSVFDARLSPAWAPPPHGYSDPWGMTRNLQNGDMGRPELLAETKDHLTELPRAVLVSPPGRREAIKPIAVDYRAGR